MQKGTHWKQQDRKLLRRKGTLMGEIQKENVQINELPPEGSYVIVNQLHTYSRGKGDEKIRTVYECNPAFYDVWNFPRIFRVDRYTKGRENALDPKNDAVLVYETANGASFEERVKTVQVAIGVLMLEVVDKDQTLYNGKGARDRNYKDYKVVQRNRYGSGGKKLSDVDNSDSVDSERADYSEEKELDANDRDYEEEPALDELADIGALDISEEEITEMVLDDELEEIIEKDRVSGGVLDDLYEGCLGGIDTIYDGRKKG